MTLSAILSLLYVLYAVGAILFVIMDRRSPASTFAWLLLLLAVPILGFIIYIMTGRSWRAFRRENRFVRDEIGDDLSTLVASRVPPQLETLEAIDAMGVPVYSRLARLGRRNSYAVISMRNSVELLQDADEKYPRLLADLKAARESIHLEYFSWASDEVMDEFNTVLLQKVVEGVEVRLLYDAVGSFFLLKGRDRRILAEGGVELEPFSPVVRLHTLSYRNHRKIVVIDGRVGYVGGLNMGKEHYDGEGVYSSWRDTHLRLEGEAVRVLQAAFVQDWYHATRRPLLAPEYFPQVKPAPAPCTAAHGQSDEGQDDTPYGTVSDSSAPASSMPTCSTLQIVTSGPDSRFEAIRQMYFYMITSASDHVYIQSPFFVIDAGLSDALKATALSGVTVKIMVAPKGSNDNPIAYWAGFTYILDVVAAGVEVYLYQPGYLHAKTVSVDGIVCSVGSANMDIRSFQIDYEINAIVYDKAVAQLVEQDFLEDLKDCVRFDPEAYQQLPFVLRLRDAASRMLSPIL